jgi:3-oxoacyl-[acyl-carrier protein] reductase
LKIEAAAALVTGGAQGLGLGIAKHLSARGAEVAVVDLDAEALAGLPGDWVRLKLDVTRPGDVRAAVADLVALRGRLDILVNNAGAIYSEPFVNLMNPSGIMHDYQRFRDCLATNLDSVFIVTSAVVEQMVKSRTRGAIVNISSVSAAGNEGQTAYAAAKAGVNAMTVTWAKELGRWGIRCNAVAPGFIDTGSTRRALDPSALKNIASRTPLRRLGEAHEVAQAVVGLIENDFITGAILNVNGGLTL